jgi:hypothetical protein
MQTSATHKCRYFSAQIRRQAWIEAPGGADKNRRTSLGAKMLMDYTYLLQRCLRPNALGDVCLHDARFGAHSGATKAHDWMVSVLGPLFRTAGHTVRTQHCVTAAQANGAAMWRFGTIFGIRPGAGAWSLTSASPMTGLGQAATCSKTVCSHTHRTSMARCAAFAQAGHQPVAAQDRCLSATIR